MLVVGTLREGAPESAPGTAAIKKIVTYIYLKKLRLPTIKCVI